MIRTETEELRQRCASDLNVIDTIEQKLNELELDISDSLRRWENTVRDDHTALWEVEREALQGDERLCNDDEDDDPSDEWVPRAILARRGVRDGKRIYYRVAWRGRNAVTWELAETVESLNRNVILQFQERCHRKERSEAKKLRPAVYEPPRLTEHRRKWRAEELQRRKAAAGTTGTGQDIPAPVPYPPSMVSYYQSRSQRPQPTLSETNAVWSCEVEPYVWIPYDEATNLLLESAHVNGAATESVAMADRNYIISFRDMTQQSVGGGSLRRVQRAVPRSTAQEERLAIQQMSLEELRSYVASLRDITPEHYEALERLAELDKVVVRATASQLDALYPVTLEYLLNEMADGHITVLGLDHECTVCLEDYAADKELCVLPACRHVYHYECIMRYFSSYSKYCPVCKERV